MEQNLLLLGSCLCTNTGIVYCSREALADIYSAVDAVNDVGTFFGSVKKKKKSGFRLCGIKIAMFSIVTHDCQNYLFLHLHRFLDVADNISRAVECICDVIHGVSLLDMAG